MTKLEYTFSNDTLFKMFFVKYPELLKRLVAELIKIKFENIESFEITNPEMPPESLGDKFWIVWNFIPNTVPLRLHVIQS